MSYQCQSCGHEFSFNEMADWTICFSCMREEQRELGYVYTDSLGIGWTEDEIQKAEGIKQIEMLCCESKLL